MQNAKATPAKAATPATLKATVAAPTPAPVAAPVAAAPATLAPAPVAAPANPPQVAPQHKVSGNVAAGPQYKLGKMPPVAVNSHRGYAQAVALHLAAQGGGTFTLAALRAAFVANPLPPTHPCYAVQPPKGGWLGHNMPTWGAKAAQGWWVLA